MLRGEVASGVLLQRAVLTAALWVVFASVVAGLLSLAGIWEPTVALPVLAVAAALAYRMAAAVPDAPMPVWSAVLLVALTVGFAGWAGATHSEQVLPRRDAGSVFQSALDLAERHTRPVDVGADDVGGARVLQVDGITVQSPAFYSVGTPAEPAIEPQFLIGPAALTSLGQWVAGPTGMFWVPALATAWGLLAVGLLVGATIGPRWAPVTVLACGLCFPLLRVARSTYSEPFAVLVLAAGLLALVRAAASAQAVLDPPVPPPPRTWETSGRPGNRRSPTSGVERVVGERVGVERAGLVAGILVGGAALVRPDALRETLLLAVVLGLAAAQRQAYARPAAVGTAAATVVAAAIGLLVSRSYLFDLRASLVPLVALLVVVVAGVLVGVRLARGAGGAVGGRRMPLLAQGWLSRTIGAVVALGLLALLTRPAWQTVRQSPLDPGARVVAALQLAQGLPVDGGRTYAEATVGWLAWWVGWPALGLAGLVAVLASARAAQRWSEAQALPAWSGPLLVGLGSTVLTLFRPGITPDHPWADRRLLVSLCLVVVLVVAATAHVSGWATRRLPVAAAPALTAVLSLALLAPTALATWPHRAERVELGSWDAVAGACAAFERGDVALLLDDRAANEWTQVVRGQCGVPSLATTATLRRDPEALAASTAEVARLVAASGRRLVLVATRSTAVLDSVGAEAVREVVDLTVQEDPRLLERRPERLVPLAVTMWVGTPRG